MKKITINVDDLGLSSAVNTAVIKLAQMQRIQSSSFMSLGLIQSDEVDELKSQRINLGLHFDLTSHLGHTHYKNTLLKILSTSWQRKWNVQQLETIVHEQLDAFENKIQAIPAFIDGHQHVHQLPQIREALINVCQKRYANTPSIRSTRPMQTTIKSHVIHHLGGKALDKQLQQYKISHNTYFGGVYNFQANEQQLDYLWEQWLQSAPESGGLIMAHPAYPSHAWTDEIKQAREQEWDYLSGDNYNNLWQKYACQAQFWESFKQPSQ